jgi:hypothetical protein
MDMTLLLDSKVAATIWINSCKYLIASSHSMCYHEKSL